MASRGSRSRVNRRHFGRVSQVVALACGPIRKLVSITSIAGFPASANRLNYGIDVIQEFRLRIVITPGLYSKRRGARFNTAA